MADFVLVREVQRPPAVVFAYLTDFDPQPEWQPGVLASQHAPAGAVQVGTTVWKGRKTPMGRVTFTDEIIEYAPEQRTYAERVGDSMIRGSGSRWTIEETEVGARLRVAVHVQAVGLGTVLEPFIVRTTQRDTDAALEHLQRILERGKEAV
jgi:uncharacterized protein YndB with AHSA1/START domain